MAFQIAMTASRLCGDHTITRHGRRRVLLVGGILSGGGLLCTACAPATTLGWAQPWAVGPFSCPPPVCFCKEL